MMNLTYENIKKTKSNLNFPSELFINGKYQKSLSEKFFDNISPIDGNVINKVFLSQQEDVHLAVSKARETFNKGHWSNLPPGQRKKILLLELWLKYSPVDVMPQRARIQVGMIVPEREKVLEALEREELEHARARLHRPRPKRHPD